jgi:hypothetical protein
MLDPLSIMNSYQWENTSGSIAVVGTGFRRTLRRRIIQQDAVGGAAQVIKLIVTGSPKVKENKHEH